MLFRSDLLFCLQCTVFCFGALVYEQSSIWNATWWTSHVLRLLAYVISLALVGYLDFFVRTRAEEDIRRLNAELENRVRHRTQELEIANRELQGFSYSVSHDLRAPLRSIHGFGEALREDCRDQLDDAGKMYLDKILAASARMSLLIEDLLRFSHVSSASILRSRVGMNQLVEEVWQELKEINPQLGGPPLLHVLPNCNVDRGLLKQVLFNLLSNAVKFTGKLASPRIEVFAESQGDEVVYAVSDNGAGFDMKYAIKLFGVFQRFHRTEEFEGTGVGLALCRRVIERHGGRIWAESSPGNGAIFRFTIGSDS